MGSLTHSNKQSFCRISSFETSVSPTNKTFPGTWSMAGREMCVLKCFSEIVFVKSFTFKYCCVQSHILAMNLMVEWWLFVSKLN